MPSTPSDVPFRVYWNLHKKCWSVQSKPRKGSHWKLHRHVEAFQTPSATFHFQPGGRERVRREQRKHVHAWAYVPSVDEMEMPFDTSKIWYRISYNPYNDRGFYTDDAWSIDNIRAAADLRFTTTGIYARLIEGDSF